MFSLPHHQEAMAGRGTGTLFHDQGLLIHFAVYAALNTLLIVINQATTPGKYRFY